MNDIKIKIDILKKQINELPKGSLVYKNINGKKQPYLQQTINGKPVSKFIKIGIREKVLKDIIHRNELIKQLKELQSREDFYGRKKNDFDFLLNCKTTIIVGENLKRMIEFVKPYKKRECFKELNDYLYNIVYSKIFILYGLRRTGKTTLIKQAILDMKEEDFNKTAYIEITPSNTLADLNKDLILLRESGYKYIFIDEATMLEDFIEGSALLPDIFASGGMKIILTGTDSLGFYFSEDNQLYDRCITLHTTFISYAEFSLLLGIKGIDNYIAYGGTMSIDGKHYNQNNLYHDKKSIDEYIDSAIAKNIQHSLKRYQYEGHFRHLEDLYLNNELTSVINRVVEDTNHRFTIDVLTKDFISHDLSISKNNLRKNTDKPTSILDDIDIKKFTNNLKQALEILNKNEQKVDIKDIHKKEIEEYLYALDLIKYITIETIPSLNENKKMTIISQPGLRYSQAKLLIEQLIQDKAFDDLSIIDKKDIIDRILNEIKGRMMEEIVLLETSIVKKNKKVFKLQFDRGEFDMVIMDKDKLTCEIYEIKHSEKIVIDQYKNLLNIEKCKQTEFKYGKITNKYVIYRGKNKTLENGIKYINVEEYLINLYK